MDLVREDLKLLTESYRDAMWENNAELRAIYGDSEEGYALFVADITERRKLAN